MIEKWKLYEHDMHGSTAGNPFTDVWIRATFSNGRIQKETEGFYKGNGLYSIRFMPPEEGNWTFVTESNLTALDGQTGSFLCDPAQADNHGRVLRSRDIRRDTMPNIYENEANYLFAYEDSTPYQPFGTACLSWATSHLELSSESIQELKASPFNKVRICLFPDSRVYKDTDPDAYPYAGNPHDGFDHTTFNNVYFENLENNLRLLDDLGIQADLILFHPNDRWGFCQMTRKEDVLYISYLARRLSHFKNVWWTLADEYDRIFSKSTADWDYYAAVLMNHDVYGHMRSIENYKHLYDYSKPWITHCSIHSTDYPKTTENVIEWRLKYQKPVLVEDCFGEGDDLHYGSLTGQEMTRRIWEAFIRGGYSCYREHFNIHEKESWLLYGGKLYGESPKRISFLRSLAKDIPAAAHSLVLNAENHEYNWDCPCLLEGENYFLYYFGFNRPSFRTYALPRGCQYSIELIDTWNMTIEKLPGIYEGNIRLEMPMKQYMAIQMKRI